MARHIETAEAGSENAQATGYAMREDPVAECPSGASPELTDDPAGPDAPGNTRRTAPPAPMSHAQAMNGPCNGGAAPMNGACTFEAPSHHDTEPDTPETAFASAGSEIPTDPQTSATPDPTADAWATAPEPAREAARERLAAVRQAEALIRAGMPAGKADRIVARTARVAGNSIAPASLGRWRRRVRNAEAGSRVALLLERPRTGRPGDITPEQAETLEALLWHHGPHLTARHARRVLVARHAPGDVPGIATVRRWLKAWREDNAAGLSAVLAPDNHRSLRTPAFGTAGTALRADGLNVLWEIDSTLCDVICSDGRRRALIAVIDVWSRRALFLVSRTSRASAIAALLRRAILSWGVPHMLVTDEGKDYVSRHVEGLLCDLEIDHRPCLPYRPDMKPHIERLIGTVSRDLFAFLPGFCGHDVSQAKALRERTAFAERRGRKHGRKNGQKNAKSAPTVLGADLDAHDLQRRLDAWAEDIYARRPHRGLIRTGDADNSGETPFERALSWTGPVRRLESERALDVLLAAPAGGGTRTVTKHGIFLGGRIYIGAELGPLVGARVAVRHDPEDEHGLIVFDCSGRFIGRARDRGAPETDRAAIAAEAKARAARRDAAARARAKKTAKDHRPETAMDDVLRGAQEDAARIAVLPRKTEPGAEPWTEPYDTPALRQANVAATASAASKASFATTANVAATADAESQGQCDRPDRNRPFPRPGGGRQAVSRR